MFGFLKKRAEQVPERRPELRPDQLQPRIKHVNFVKVLQANGLPAAQQPPTRSLCGELLITYAFDLPDMLQMVTPQTLQEVDVSPGALHSLAVANLKRVLPQPEFFAKNSVGLAQTGAGLEATLLLMDDIWDAMQPNFSGQTATA